MIFPTKDNSLLVMVDLQTKLLPVVVDPEKVIRRAEIMLRGAAEIGVDIIVTEQYPKGLGNTLPELSTWLPDSAPVVAKSSFSVFGTPEFCTHLLSRKREVLIFIGVETHVCLLQSILDARSKGYEVIVAADAVSSRKESDKQWGLEAARAAGAWILSCEAILFMLLRDSKNPAFKAVSGLIK
ncbi:MAG: isochorismatase family protein [Lentisphaerae bacterium]|nr:isochorismatase family protein [Lentisphaerota bacterium]